MSQRSTIDIVVIILTAMVALTVFCSALATVIGKIHNPSLDVARVSELLGNSITTITGALVGFVGGRAVGRNEANGK